jgi:hypothetical protein
MKKRIVEVFVCMLLIATVLPGTGVAANWIEEQRILPSDVKEGDFVNWLVSLDGDTALLGACGYGERMGTAYVFHRSGSTWTQEAMLQAPKQSPDQLYFGSIVSIDGDTALVGSVNSVYVFIRSGTTWTQQAKLLTSNNYNYIVDTNPISLDGDTALIGANGDMVYVFTRTGTTWTQRATLQASDDDESQSYFGKTVSLSGNTALIGAYLERNDYGTDMGAAYVFTRTGTTWTQQAKIVYPGNQSSPAQFGWDVSLDGDTALIGSKADSTYSAGWSTTAHGSAFVYTRTGNTWTLQQKLEALDTEQHEYFGHSVSLDGNKALIGVRDYHGLLGAAYVFIRSGTTWTQQAILEASDRQSGKADSFGWMVSLSGNTALIGTAENLGGADLDTKVYVFVQSGETQPNQSPTTSFSWTPSNPIPDQTITFDASASNDPDGSITKYEWDWNNDGTYENSYTASTTTHTWSQNGSYPVKLQVTDNSGATNTKTLSVTVGGGGGDGNGGTDNKGTPGFELIVVIGAIAVALFLWRKKRNV